MISSQEQIENENIAKHSVTPFKMRKTKTKTKKNAVALGGRLLRQRSETSSVTYARYVGTYSIYSTVSNQQSEQSPECFTARLLGLI